MKTVRLQNRKTTSNHRLDNTRRDNKDQICDICAQNVPGPEREKIFALGKCDHNVCYVCSTRLRVICDQSDCPSCREKLDDVIFSSNRNYSYAKFNLKNFLFNEKYKIYFESQAIKEVFDKLLKFECQECIKISEKSKSITKTKLVVKKQVKDELKLSPYKENSNAKSRQQKQLNKDSSTGDEESSRNATASPSGNGDHNEFRYTKGGASTNDERLEEDSQGLLETKDIKNCVFPDVFGLKNHLNYVHKLKLCDLCLTHNKLFPFEYNYYDNLALKKHMKEGEPKTSYRGHPSCVLCHNTFFNNDELIQHMSREHFHCHLCERVDSNMRIYFLDYSSLRDHFKAKHFLCEREHCRHEQLTSAFENMVDFHMHLVDVHGSPTSGLSRGEVRQRRTITLDSAPHRARPVSPNQSLRQGLPRNAAVVSIGNIATANNARQPHPESIQIQLRQQRLPTRAEFPMLGQEVASRNPRPAPSQQVTSTQNYPSLSQANSSSQISTSTSTSTNQTSTMSQLISAGPSGSSRSFNRFLGGGVRMPEQLNEMDFPPLPEQPKKKGVKKNKSQNSSSNGNINGELTLDQLISSSLTLADRNNRFNRKKAGSKGGTSKSSKNVKPKSLKIQLS